MSHWRVFVAVAPPLLGDLLVRLLQRSDILFVVANAALACEDGPFDVAIVNQGEVSPSCAECVVWLASSPDTALSPWEPQPPTVVATRMEDVATVLRRLLPEGGQCDRALGAAGGL